MAQRLVNGKYMTTAQAAEAIGVSKDTLLRWFRQNKIADVRKDSRGWRKFTYEDVDFIRSNLNAVREPQAPPYDPRQTEFFSRSYKISNKPTCIDLFAGAGGLALGFHNAGFQCIAANDTDSDSAKTFLSNGLTDKYHVCGIEELTSDDFMRESNLERGALDCLVGGPPCQAFSVYNHKRSMQDNRSRLFEHYLRIVRGLQPKCVVLENVTGILSLAGGQALEEIHAGLQKLGYRTKHRVLWAEHFGVPQERRRVFVIGVREDIGEPDSMFPRPTYQSRTREKDPSSCHKPFVTVREAIGDLPCIDSGGGTSITEYSLPAKMAYQRRMRKSQKKLHNHVAGRLAPINIERLQHIPPGGSWRDLPYELLPPGMKRAKRSDHTKRYGRLDPDGLSCTILTKADPHWGSYFHYEQDRVITVREAARLQSFPDSYIFGGALGSQFRQIGNAVPPLLAQAIARTILRTLQNS